MTSTRSYCFERNKESPSFRTNDDTIIVQCFAFLYFPAINIKLSLFISRDLSPEICLVFYVSISCVKLKLFSLFHFNEIYFLEWSRYLFNNTYIVRSSLVVIYPGR